MQDFDEDFTDVSSFTGSNKVKDPELWSGFRRSIKAADNQRRHSAKCNECGAKFLGIRGNLLTHRSKCVAAVDVSQSQVQMALSELIPHPSDRLSSVKVERMDPLVSYHKYISD